MTRASLASMSLMGLTVALAAKPAAALISLSAVPEPTGMVPIAIAAAGAFVVYQVRKRR